MKRFEFKMQPLLNYRQYLERLAQQDTAKANMNVKNCEKKIAHLKQVYDQNADKIQTIVDQGISASKFKQYHQYLDSVQDGIKEEKLKELDLKKRLKEKLLVLRKKSVDKKAMELYREKLKAVYTQEVIKNEQKEQDEISSIKTARTRNQ